MPILNRERLEAWLFSQPPQRQFNYVQGYPGSVPGCLLCNFLTDSGLKFRHVGPDWVLVALGTESEWFDREIKDFSRALSSFSDCEFTAGQAQAAYIALFGPVTALNSPQDTPEPVPGADMVVETGKALV